LLFLARASASPGATLVDSSRITLPDDEDEDDDPSTKYF
jgi:hypothetical protein